MKTKLLSLVLAVMVMVAALPCAVTAEGAPEKLPFGERFTDAAKVSSWAENACEAIYDAGLVSGFEDGTLRPRDNATRAHAWAYLYRCAEYLGKDVSVPEDFTVDYIDAVAGAWYEDALRFVAYNGILCVSDADTVAPDRGLVRWEMAVEFYRFIDYAGLEYSKDTVSRTLEDIDSVPEWAVELIYGIMETGLINGVTMVDFLPEGAVTHEQYMTFLNRVFDSTTDDGVSLKPTDTEPAAFPVPTDDFRMHINTADKLIYGAGDVRVLGMLGSSAEGCLSEMKIVVKNSLWEESVLLFHDKDIGEEDHIFGYTIPFGKTAQTVDGQSVELVSESADWYVGIVAYDSLGNTLTVDHKVTVLSAEEGREEFFWSVEGNTAKLLNYIGDDTEVRIPDMLDGSYVGVIHNDCFADDNVTELAIPETVYYIGDVMGAQERMPKITFYGSECEYNSIEIHVDMAEAKVTYTETYPDHAYTEEAEVILEPSAIVEGIKGRYCIYCYDVQDVEYIPMKKVELNFTDVSEGSWYRKAVEFAVDEGLFNGMTETTFCPEVPMTRAMLVTVLYRMEGSPDIHPSNPFDDVESGAWYEKAVAWANANRIVLGVYSNKFAPDENITREALATMLFRYSNYAAINRDVRADLTSFEDGDTVSDWAKDTVSWASGVGIIAGNNIGGKVLLDPQGKATRAQVATMLARFSIYKDYGVIV